MLYRYSMTLTLYCCLQSNLREYLTQFILSVKCYLTIIQYIVVFHNPTDVLAFDILLESLLRRLELRQHADAMDFCSRLKQATPQPGEEKTLCHIFPVDPFANSDCGPLHCFCIAVHCKEEKESSLAICFSSIVKSVKISIRLLFH